MPPYSRKSPSTCTADQLADRPRPIRNFISTPVEALRTLISPGCNLYLVEYGSSRPVLYCAGEYSFSAEDIRRLQAGGIHYLYLHRSDQHRYQERLLENLGPLLEQEEIAVAGRLSLLKSAFAAQLSRVFRMAKADAMVEESTRVGTHIATLMQSSDVVPAELMALVTHSRDTFCHLINVSSYAVVLAMRLGITGQAELADIATGGMLHDLGKRWIPESILHKPGPLDPAEWQIMRQHPAKGYKELYGRDDVRFEQSLMAYQHHERMDGSGYPVGITAGEIHFWSRLCAVIDVFEALTGRCAYRESLDPGVVAEVLEEQGRDHLDKEIVQCWVSALREK